MRDQVRRCAVGVAICAALLSSWACGSNAQHRTTAPTVTDPGRPSAPVHAGKGKAGTRSGNASARGPATTSSGTPHPAGLTAAFTRTVLPASTAISSDQYHQAIVAAVDRGRKTTPKIAEAFAGCIQRILQNADIRTVGEAARIKRNPTGDKRLAGFVLQCLAAAGP
jgi:hypothetical protein